MNSGSVIFCSRKTGSEFCGDKVSVIVNKTTVLNSDTIMYVISKAPAIGFEASHFLRDRSL